MPAGSAPSCSSSIILERAATAETMEAFGPETIVGKKVVTPCEARCGT
jgi:hypothetical protein